MERGPICLMKVLVTGGTGGVGQAVIKCLSSQHTIIAPTRDELDLSKFSTIEQLDLSDIDLVINCASSNHGAWQGFQNNSWQNQQNQTDVNFTGALLLAKQYIKQRTHGQFIYITSTNINDPISYNMFYTASKAALRFSMNTLKREYKNILFTEICPGKIKTNMLKQNYQGTKTDAEIEEMYAQGPALEAVDIVDAINICIKYKLDQVTISPHEKP